jgi:glycosyltransferase involved in cell wall biosynthesis
MAFVGPIKTYKHPEVALDVLEGLLPEFPDLHLDVVGWDRGGLSESLIKKATRLGIQEHVTFRGWLSEEEKADLLRDAWVLLQPSEREGWSLVVMEAAACGTPAVATAVGGLRESVRHGVTGLLVPYRDKQAFVEAVRRVLGDGALRSLLSSGAIYWALQFSWERCSREVFSVLQGVLSQGGNEGKNKYCSFGSMRQRRV